MTEDPPCSFPSALVKVATYNIHKAVGTDRRYNPLRILKVLNEVGADIVVLQEADCRFGARSSTLPAVLIQNHTDYVPVPLDVQKGSIGWHGNAILVRSSVAVEHHDILRIPCLEPRGVVSATLRIGNDTLCVFGMHLDLSGLWRVRQAKVIADFANACRHHHPTLMMGDINEWRARAGCFREFSRHFNVLDCGPSFHSRRPVASLDRIMHRDGLSVRGCGVHRSPLASVASDHLPVWAEFAFAGSTQKHGVSVKVA